MRLQARTIHGPNFTARCNSNLSKFNALIPCYPDVSLMESLSCPSPEGQALGGCVNPHPMSIECHIGEMF